MFESREQHTLVKGRYGRIKRNVLWQRLGAKEMPELRRLSSVTRRQFIAAVKSGKISDRQPVQIDPEDPLFVTGLTAQKYLEYCAICIRSISPREGSTPPREIYRTWADGRHGGLLDLKPHNKSAFASWLIRPNDGSHPFEIVRDSMKLVVHPRMIGPVGRTCWLRLFDRRRIVGADTITMALALAGAGVRVCVEDVDHHAIYAVGDDYIGVAEDRVWEAGTPIWPAQSGIFETGSSSLSTLDFEKMRDILDHVEWFAGRSVPIATHPGDSTSIGVAPKA